MTTCAPELKEPTVNLTVEPSRTKGSRHHLTTISPGESPFHLVSDNKSILQKMSDLAHRFGYRVRRYTFDALVVEHERENVVRDFERARTENVIVLLQLRPGERHILEAAHPTEAKRIERNSIWFPTE